MCRNKSRPSPKGATAVQISGVGNTLTITRGGASLALQRLHSRRADPTSLIELLRTDIRATTLAGREPELRSLAEWCSAPQHIAVRCYTGRAGAGKTRLAIEACEAAEAEVGSLRSCRAASWRAFILRRTLSTGCSPKTH